MKVKCMIYLYNVKLWGIVFAHWTIPEEKDYFKGVALEILRYPI